MNRETIEKAADNYSAEIMPAYSDGYFEKYQLADAFETGADWRINSVWHDEFEVPESGKYVLAINGNKHGCRILWMNTDPVNWDEYVEANGIKRWAYTSDLLPDGKEEAL